MQTRFDDWPAQVLDVNDVKSVVRDVGRYGFAIVCDKWR
ncbi:clavaminate synthase, partial [Xanthomonas translucens pv. translucens]|nr:clavaminate synthase [Xanthomonas translucens pv. translucens]MCT8305352.1 clavaminate synthase [Xanthomonas translucens pv. translucens]